MPIFNSRTLFGVGALSLGAWSFSAPLMMEDMFDGYVVAREISIRAPATGKLNWEAGAGNVFDEGQVLGKIADAHDDATALIWQISSLQEVSLQLGRNGNDLVRFRLGFLEEKLAVVRAELGILEHDLGEAVRKRENAARLSKSGATSKEELRTREAHAARLQLEVSAKRGAVRQAEIEAEAARGGSFISEGYNDVPYSVQRKIDIDLRIGELEGQLRRFNSTRRDAGTAAQILSPLPGKLSALKAAKGQPVAKGDEIATFYDCGSLSVVMDLPSRDFEGLEVGQDMVLKLAGIAAPIAATVERIEAAVNAGQAGAGRDTDRVSVEIASADLSRACPVGRRTEISFSRPTSTVGTWFSQVYAMLGLTPAYADGNALPVEAGKAAAAAPRA